MAREKHSAQATFIHARVHAAMLIQNMWRGRRNRNMFSKLIRRVRVHDHVHRAVKADRAKFRWQQAIAAVEQAAGGSLAAVPPPSPPQVRPTFRASYCGH